jgi:hypothetical protein
MASFTVLRWLTRSGMQGSLPKTGFELGSVVACYCMSFGLFVAGIPDSLAME